MRKTASGRWLPDKPEPETEREPTEFEIMQAYVRQAIASGVEMPWWYPEMHFWAAIGRLDHASDA